MPKPQRKKKQQKPVVTFTKKAVKGLLIVGVINGTIPFVLAALGRDPVAELGIAWITEIVAVILGYLVKSFNENRQIAIQRHEDLVAGIEEGYSLHNPEAVDDSNNIETEEDEVL